MLPSPPCSGERFRFHKVRVAFNALLKTTHSLSLNDNLLAGETIQQDLFSILTRFRTLEYVLSDDI